MAATKTASTFRQTYAVRCTIRAPAEVVWALLTDGKQVPTWSSTVTSIEGEIALGGKLAVRVPLDPKRTFRPKVTAFEVNRRMTWSDGFAPMFRGVRTFELVPREDGTTEFAMSETLGGLMFPVIKGSLPDFAPAFETYAADLKRAAEKGH